MKKKHLLILAIAVGFASIFYFAGDFPCFDAAPPAAGSSAPRP